MYTYLSLSIYIYIYIERERDRERARLRHQSATVPRCPSRSPESCDIRGVLKADRLEYVSYRAYVV